MKKRLFSLKEEYMQYLKDGSVDDVLKKIFEENNLSLSGEAMIDQEDDKNWTVLGGKEVYAIKLENKQLNIYSKIKVENIVSSIVLDGYCEDKFLFNLNLDYKSHLEDESVNDTLRNAFEDNKLSLSSEAKITKKDDTIWIMKDSGKAYKIEDDGKNLKISEVNTLDLEKLSQSDVDIENPVRFPGVIYKVKDPKVAMLIFRTGKIICSGARSRENIDVAVKNLMEKLNNAGMPVKNFPAIKVENIVASFKLPYRINLEVLAFESEDTEYEPEQFPGLVLRLKEPKTVMLIFKSGKIIITGAKTPQEADIAAQKTTDLIEELDGIIEELPQAEPKEEA